MCRYFPILTALAVDIDVTDTELTAVHLANRLFS